MYRKLILSLAALLLSVGCAVPSGPQVSPEAREEARVELAEMIEAVKNGEELDVEAAVALAEVAYSSSSSPIPLSEVPPVNLHDVTFRIQDKNPDPVEVEEIGPYVPFLAEGVFQRWEWPITLELRDVELLGSRDDIFTVTVRVPVSWGCFDTKARFVRIEEIDGAPPVQVLSAYSNTKTLGECISPEPERIPIAVSEPGEVLTLASGAALLGILYRRRK